MHRIRIASAWVVLHAASSYALPLLPPEHRIAVTGDTAGHAELRAYRSTTTWSDRTPNLVIPAGANLRYFADRLYAISPAADSISAVDPQTWTIARTYALPPGSRPIDLAVVGARTAYVSAAALPNLLRLDLRTGAVATAADLSPFADADSIPDMNFMSIADNRLFIQLRRENNGLPVAPPSLAVLDATTGQLIDADPATPGTQAITLQGAAPKGKMTLIAAARRLFISASGIYQDFAGGIEIVDLDTLRSTHLIVRESDDQVGADLGAIVATGPDRGFLVFTTDFALSTHLHRFSISSGVDQAEHYVTLNYFSPTILHHPVAQTIFLPVGGWSDDGIHVFDASTGDRLTASPLPAAGVPTDIAFYYAGCTPPADANGDGAADGRDIQSFVACAVAQTPGCECTDLDADGRTDVNDLNLLTGILTDR